jgi:hypothetical protein
MTEQRYSNTIDKFPVPKPLHPALRTLGVCILLIGTPGAAAWVGTYFTQEHETAQTEIYRGVFYRSYRDGPGMIYLIEVDLSRPGLELFLTPLAPEAVARGYQYRLDYVRNSARVEGLAVAVNGPFFSSDSYLVPMVGDFATGVESIVSNHQISHLNPLDYMLWFDEQLTPHLETTRPTPSHALRKAKWAIGGRALVVRGGKSPNHSPYDKKTLVGVDPERRMMWIGIFEWSTDAAAADALMLAGAHYVMILDGGDSTSLYLGGRARDVPPGLRFGGQRPVATVFGVKADPILDPS